MQSRVHISSLWPDRAPLLTTTILMCLVLTGGRGSGCEEVKLGILISQSLLSPLMEDRQPPRIFKSLPQDICGTGVRVKKEPCLWQDNLWSLTHQVYCGITSTRQHHLLPCLVPRCYGMLGPNPPSARAQVPPRLRDSSDCTPWRGRLDGPWRVSEQGSRWQTTHPGEVVGDEGHAEVHCPISLQL